MKKSIIFPLFLLLFIAACGEKQPPPTDDTTVAEPDLTILPGAKVGLITPANCTREGILAAYGKDAKVDSVYLFEGQFGEGVVIYPDNPRRTVTVYWDNEFDAKRPAFIRIDGDSTGTDWKTADGITIGTSVTKVQELNGKAFDIAGFGWDYGGFVTDWKGGKFNNSAQMLRFEPKSTEVSEKIVGEGGFSSDNPDMIAANPVVIRMEFSFRANDKLPDCIMALVNADKVDGHMMVRKMNINGVDHYWLNSGAAAYDGIEFIYDADCKEVCKTGGMRKPLDCMNVYEKGKWELVWEEE